MQTVTSCSSRCNPLFASVPFWLHTKRRGELAEAMFLVRVLLLGFIACKPYGDSAPFDWVIAGAARAMKRVQVKAAFTLKNRSSYRVSCSTAGHRKTYTAQDIDFLAAYVAPHDLWYIIPVSAFTPRSALCFQPGKPAGEEEWGKYREAWWRLGRVPRPAAVTTDNGKLATANWELATAFSHSPR